MRVGAKHFQSIWWDSGDKSVYLIDQRRLPFEIKVIKMSSLKDATDCIGDMAVRGAPLIGATATYGMYLAAMELSSFTGFYSELQKAGQQLERTRPTAVNLKWAVDKQLAVAQNSASLADLQERLLACAVEVCDEDIQRNKSLGLHGLELIRKISTEQNNRKINILTHCNAGWLATVDYGTATSPIYQAHDEGIDLHVWVDETRPRNQGARLTAWELGQHGVDHTIIVDNAGGHLMQHGMVDICIVGTDRTTRTGDVANKIGTYLKALAAHDNGVPFYVAAPSPSIDWSLTDGISEIAIETRNQDEITHIEGLNGDQVQSVLVCPDTSRAVNYGFDVTPAKYVTGLITERGVCDASERGLFSLYPEKNIV